MSLYILSRRFICIALTGALVTGLCASAQAGFVMGSSANNDKTPHGYSTTPMPSDPVTPEYNGIQSQTLEVAPKTPVLSAPAPDVVESAPISDEPAPFAPPPVKHAPSYAEPDHDAFFKPAPIAKPQLSTEQPEPNPSMQLKQIGNLPVTKPETRVQPIDSTPDNMPYQSGYDTMHKPALSAPTKAWNDSSSDLRPQNQGQQRRISQELQKQNTVINPYPDSQVPRTMVEQPAPVPAKPVAPAAPTHFNDAVGFASDIPLALALSQVVPPEYAYSFATGVNPGYRVSWNGGKPWNVVVQEMVAPLNLQAEISGNMVYIKPAGGQQGAATLPGAPVKSALQTQREISIPPADIEERNFAPAGMAASAPQKTASNDIGALEKITNVRNVETVKAVPVTEAAPAPAAQTKPAPVKTASLPGSAPPPPAFEVDPESDTVPDTSRRNVIRDPGEFASTQPSQAAKPIKDIKDFRPAPSAAQFEPASGNVDQQQNASAAPAPLPVSNVDSEQSQNQPRIWEAKQGDSLKKVLGDWSTQANVELDWGAAHDYALASNVFINGTYSNAIKILFTHGFDAGQAPAHKMTEAEGKTVLVVQDHPV